MSAARGERSAAFYCVVSARYFVGAVGMINSLRLAGHRERIYALECGLSESQRELLAGEATVLTAPRDREPYELKTHAPLAQPADVAVLIDCDLIVTRSLEPLVARAAEGRVVAFENPVDRYVPEWGELLKLGPVERRPYLCSALVAMGRDPGAAVLELLADRQRLVRFERGHFGAADRGYALLYADQDVLNAILGARVERERVVALESRLAPMPPFRGLRLVGAGADLRCVDDRGAEPYLVHHSLPFKPWLEPSPGGIYTALLRRMLTGPDLPLRIKGSELPPWLRRGLAGTLARRRARGGEGATA